MTKKQYDGIKLNAARTFVLEFARQIPGSFTCDEGIRCFLGGIAWLEEEQSEKALKKALKEVKKIGRANGRGFLDHT